MASPPAGNAPTPAAAAAAAAASKGKALMGDEAGVAEEAVTCGICLAETPPAIRGELDCCHHRFCFVCIMAWARVESRCPFCKARFRTIRRPPVPGRFPAERVVPVVERTQAYCPLNNVVSTVDIDPYENTNCSVCSLSTNEELLLLCELCDAAAHTYCIGLGSTVPEGDWFCKDCALSKEDHSKCQIDDEGCSDQGGFETSVEVSRAGPVAAPSIYDIVDEVHYPSSASRTDAQGIRLSLVNPIPSTFDIVDEDYTTRAMRRTNAHSTRLERNAEQLPSQSTSAGHRSPEPLQERNSRCASLHTLACFNVDRAKTVRSSRFVNSRIRVLRESWPAIRAGSVGFAEDLPNSRKENGTESASVSREHQLFATATTSSSQSGATSSASARAFTKETTTISGRANKISPKDTHNVRKAWKMLEMVNSSGGRKNSNKPSSMDCNPSFSMGNRSTSYSPIDTILGRTKQNPSNEVTQKNTAKYHCCTKKDNTQSTKNFKIDHSLSGNNHVSLHERMVSFQERRTNQESPNGKVASSSQSQHSDRTLQSSCDRVRLRKTKPDVLRPLACSLSPDQSMVTSSVQSGISSGSQPTMLVNPKGLSSICVAEDNEIGTAGAATEDRKKSRQDHHKCKRKLCFETCDDQESKKSRTTCKIDKSEISSLAIRELKLLKIDKTYGSDRFKELARAVTHTVLASCGLKHLSSVALTVSRPVCKHSNRIEPLKSSAITNSCRECLCNFVKEVISSVLSGRQLDETPESC